MPESPSKSISPELILASSSPYRKQLLSKLTLSFECISPEIDESPLQNETPEALVKRLSLEKAQAISADRPNALIIGSDQVAVLDGDIITKPMDHEHAVLQLRKASGREVRFLTGLCLYNSLTQHCQLTMVPYAVNFLELTETQIENYLKKEQPYNCAGSFKSEGLGITLFSSMTGKDPNSLIGLPLINLVEMLRKEGIDPLSS
jgi:MAF protein